MKIFCSGIGGIGLSAYASLQRAVGHDVSGSDRSDSPLIADLRSQGITVSLEQDGSAIPENCDLFVYSEAIPITSSERKKAADLHVKQVSYPEALAGIQADYNTIAVCGTHGKSSTTAMTARMLMETGNDPTVVVGTKMKELAGRNWRRGEGDLFVFEACEYRRAFLHYAPQIILLTNCDGDHFDYYTSPEDYRDAFAAFLAKLPPDGIVITHGKDPVCAALAKGSGRKVIDADAFPLISLQTPGLHMRQNAQLALALVDVLNIPQEKAMRALSGYSGSWRRMEVRGELPGGVTVIDDYGHHPAEIRATLAALREAYPKRRLVCVFQPHTHDRTLKLYDAFTEAFGDCDALIIPDIYVARSDTETKRVDVDAFVGDIAKKSRTNVINGQSLARTEKLLRDKVLQPGDVLLCMGAGNITQLSDAILKLA